MDLEARPGIWKYAVGWTAVFLFRLIPFRPPNVEPMLAAVMPYAKGFGPVPSFLFGFFGIVAYDAVTSGWGAWTWATAISYGLLGLAAHAFFRTRAASVFNFVAFAVVGTIAYDAVTMLIGPIFAGQPLMLALVGQIPFTLLHLTGAVLFASLVSPALYRFLAPAVPVRDRSAAPVAAKRI